MGSSLRNLLRGLLYLSPNLFGFLLFTFVPVLAVFVVAFTKGEYTSHLDPATGTVTIDATWCGLEHFERMAKGFPLVHDPDAPVAPGEVRGDPEFWQSLWNTFVLLLAVPLQMALALALAILINQRVPGQVVYRTLLFLPTVAAGIALYMLWRQLYNPEYGLLNRTLEVLHIVDPGQGPDWLGNRWLAKPSILIMLVWIGMGGTNMVLYLAGLQDIDPSLYEAADIDGAGPWDKFIHITWPALRPTTFFILTTNLIGAMQIFDQILIMTGGGPEGATTTVLYYVYRNIYEYQGQVGYAAALSVVLFFLVFVVTLFNWTINKKARQA